MATPPCARWASERYTYNGNALNGHSLFCFGRTLITFKASSMSNGRLSDGEGCAWKIVFNLVHREDTGFPLRDLWISNQKPHTPWEFINGRLQKNVLQGCPMIEKKLHNCIFWQTKVASSWWKHRLSLFANANKIKDVERSTEIRFLLCTFLKILSMCFFSSKLSWCRNIQSKK